MSNDFEPRDLVSPPSDRSAEYGLGSAMIGATVFLAAPIVAILAAQLWAHADRSPGTVALHAWLVRIAVGVPILLVIGGIWLGVAGLRQAKRYNATGALSIAGVFLNLAALCGWSLASIGLLNSTESMLLLVR